MRIQLSEMIGERCITVEQGKALFDAIQSPLKAGEEVVIDLAGVKTLLSLFLNNSVGLLFRDFEPEAVGRLLHIENATQSQQETLERVMTNAKAYHRDPERRKVVDAALARIVEEMD